MMKRKRNYWLRRQNFLYYAKIIEICSEILKNNINYSIIDFGCKNTEIIFELKCNKKFLFDIKNRYRKSQKEKIIKKNITFIEDSIYNINYSNEFDICLCLQTLEHLENPRLAFDLIYKASKKYIIISLPYKWIGLEGDFHKDIDEKVIKKWSRIEPDQSFIIKGKHEMPRIINIYIKK